MAKKNKFSINQPSRSKEEKAEEFIRKGDSLPENGALPWEQPFVREDIKKGVSTYLTEVEKIQLEWLVKKRDSTVSKTIYVLITDYLKAGLKEELGALRDKP